MEESDSDRQLIKSQTAAIYFQLHKFSRLSRVSSTIHNFSCNFFQKIEKLAQK